MISCRFCLKLNGRIRFISNIKSPYTSCKQLYDLKIGWCFFLSSNNTGKIRKVSYFFLYIVYTLEGTAENVQIIGIPILILCIYIAEASPKSHTYFAPGEKIRNKLQVKRHKICPTGRSQSVECETYTWQNGHNRSYDLRFIQS